MGVLVSLYSCYRQHLNFSKPNHNGVSCVCYWTFTPIIAVLIDELLMNKQNTKIAHALTRDCYSTWTNFLSKKLDLEEVERLTEQHMGYWQNVRLSATPIFEWLYKISRDRMERNMLVDNDELISEYQKC